MSDDFSARYRLLKCIAVDGGLRTHSAQELATGRVVMVHLADAAGPEAVEQLRAQLARLTGADKNRVLETATIPAGFAIVTEFVTTMTSFVGWLAERSGGATIPPAAPPPLAPIVQPVAPPIVPAVAAPPAPVGEAPGSFTALFSTPMAAAPMAAVPAPAPQPPTPAPQPPAPQAPAPQPPAPQLPPEPPAPEAGSFTMMFGGPMGAAPTTEQRPAKAVPPPVLTPPIFTPPVMTPPVVTPPMLTPPSAPIVAPPPAAGDFTRMFGAAGGAMTPPLAPFKPPTSSPASPPPAPATPPPKAASGEFTRMFSGLPTAAPLPESARPSPMATPPTPVPSWTPVHSPSNAPPPSPMATPPFAASAFGSPPPLAPPAGANMGGATGALFGSPATPPMPAAHHSDSPLFGGPMRPMPPLATPPGSSPQPAITGAPLSAMSSPLSSTPSNIPSVLPPPVFKNASSTPLSSLGGAPPVSGAAGPSDFTMMIRGAPAPVVPVIELKAPESPKGTGAPPKRGIPTGLIVVINAVILVAVILVVLVLRKPTPRTPTLPTAPTISAPAAPAVPSAPKLK